MKDKTFEKYLVTEGRFDHNLGDSNNYWVVKKPFDVYVNIGVQGRMHVGALYSPSYKKVTAKRGDEIHNLHGGIFLVRIRNKEASHVKMYDPNTPHVKHYSKFPMDKIDQMEVAMAMSVRYN